MSAVVCTACRRPDRPAVAFPDGSGAACRECMEAALGAGDRALRLVREAPIAPRPPAAGRRRPLKN